MRSSLKKRVERREKKIHDFSRRLTTTVDPFSVSSEAFRTLRAGLLYYAHLDTPPKVVVVTSSGPREGKSTVCANLGVIMAQAGKSTLIVDCDFRHPVMHQIFGLDNRQGVVDFLIGRCGLQETWYEALAFLKVSPVGPLPPNPVELVGSLRFTEFISRACQEFEYVLVDASPVGLFSDSLTLATQGDGVLLVLDAQNTRKRAVRQAVRSLDAVGANVLGTVMNNIPRAETAYRRYHPG